MVVEENWERKNKDLRRHSSKPTPMTSQKQFSDFSGGPVVKNPPANAGDTGLVPGWGTEIPQALSLGQKKKQKKKKKFFLRERN